MNPLASPCVVIGDLVGSRSVPDRREVHRVLEKALVAVNALVPAMTELRVTAGDEFQGSYRTLGAAIDAALRVRLEDRAVRAPLRALRTAFQVAQPDQQEAAQELAVNAALQARDQLIGELGDRSLRLLRGLLDPHKTQSELAAVEGISPSAVSQRVRADGLGVVLLGHESLVAMP